jgi:hypothetical protein
LDDVSPIGPNRQVHLGIRLPAKFLGFDFQLFDRARQCVVRDRFMFVVRAVPEIPEAFAVLAVGIDVTGLGRMAETEGGGWTIARSQFVQDGLQ